jgi:hypothetical protein
MATMPSPMATRIDPAPRVGPSRFLAAFAVKPLLRPVPMLFRLPPLHLDPCQGSYWHKQRLFHYYSCIQKQKNKAGNSAQNFLIILVTKVRTDSLSTDYNKRATCFCKTAAATLAWRTSTSPARHGYHAQPYGS